jgi:nitrite reductase/ring-hydroxylating ferredoxin subunit
MGTGPDQNASHERTRSWAALTGRGGPGDDHFLGQADGEPVLVTRDGVSWQAIGDRCSHRGGPLHEGELQAGCVTCPWHASMFRTSDGAVLRGPASAPQPAYDVRSVGEDFEVRARS